MLPKPANIFRQFAESVDKNSSKDAVLSADFDGVYHSETYLSIYQKSLAFAQILKAKGVQPGDRVAVLSENRPEFLWVTFAIFSRGAILVPLDTQYSSLAIDSLVTHCGARILVSTERFKLIHQQEVKTKWLCIDDEFVQSGITESNGQIKKGEACPQQEVAALFYTSGTTDVPKAVMLTHQNFFSNVQSIYQTGLIFKNDVVLSILPLHHTYAFTVTLVLPLLYGMTIAYPKSLSSVDLLACIKQTCTTVFVGVPQIFSTIHRSIKDRINQQGYASQTVVNIAEGVSVIARKWSGINIGKKVFQAAHQRFGPSLRVMVSGGARLDPVIAEDFYRWGFTLVEGYGLTETAPVVSFSIPDHPKFGSVGRPLPGVEIRVHQPNSDGEGEVVVKGDNVMKGYYQLENETRYVLQDGWFFTGDIGRIDREGFLFLTGRKKEMLVLSSGEKISPEELESFYTRNPFVKEIAVLTVDDADRTAGISKLVAIIVPDEEHFRSQEELNIHKRMKWEIENYSVQLPTYKRIRGFFLTQENLPRTRLGKLKRFELEQIYKHLKMGEPAVRPQEQRVYSDFSRSILQFFENYLGRKVSPDDHLELDIGLDSLGRLELFVAAQQQFGMTFSEKESEVFFSCTTVGQVISQLKTLTEQSEIVDKNTDTQTNAVSPVAEKALAYIKDRLGGREVLHKDHLELDLGFDSLSRIELLLGIQQHLDLGLTDDQAISFLLCNRIGDLLNELNKVVAAAPSVQVQQPVIVNWRDILFSDPDYVEIKEVQKMPLSLFKKIFNVMVLGFFKVLFKLLFRLDVQGGKFLPKNGPYVICSNHNSYLDGLFIAGALPFRLAMQTFFLGDSKFLDHELIRPFKKIARLISIQFTHQMTDALRMCSYILRQENILVYFPEGQRSIDGKVEEFRKGIGVLIQELEIPVVPVYIKGTFSVWPRGQKWPRPGKVSVVFGPPVTVQELRFKLTHNEDVYQRIAENLRQKVVGLS